MPAAIFACFLIYFASPYSFLIKIRWWRRHFILFFITSCKSGKGKKCLWLRLASCLLIPFDDDGRKRQIRQKGAGNEAISDACIFSRGKEKQFCVIFFSKINDLCNNQKKFFFGAGERGIRLHACAAAPSRTNQRFKFPALSIWPIYFIFLDLPVKLTDVAIGILFESTWMHFNQLEGVGS